MTFHALCKENHNERDPSAVPRSRGPTVPWLPRGGNSVLKFTKCPRFFLGSSSALLRFFLETREKPFVCHFLRKKLRSCIMHEVIAGTCLSLSIPVCPCLSLPVPVCPCQSVPVPAVRIFRCYLSSTRKETNRTDFSVATVFFSRRG